MTETPSSIDISTKLERIAKQAKEMPGVALSTLAHHIDVAWLREAYRRTRKGGATGIDGQTAEQYAERLEENLQSLLDRAKSGSYRAPPVRRVHIPKGDGSDTRPIGIPTFEDKVLQRAVTMLLEAVYETSFHDFSYGFRPGRSAHQALEAVRDTAMIAGGGWILEVDIKKFFDSLDHSHLQAILRQRIRDGVILRLIGKWLNAGVMEGVELSHPAEGTPQGGVISPLLANVYLHEVLDEWFVRDVWPRLKGRATLVRYADDFVFFFKRRDDADRVFEVLPKRFGKYGLTLHPDKTRLVPFQRPDRIDDDDDSGSGSFDLLGFTHHWALSRKGSWVVKRRTAKDRFSRALRRIREWCRSHRHDPVAAQHQMIVRKLDGHYGYYGLNGNFDALTRLRYETVLAWRKWLSRRSQKGYINWASMFELLKRFPIPQPRLAARYRA
jgi:group II intron reverse transcriptase/maturase